MPKKHICVFSGRDPLKTVEIRVFPAFLGRPAQPKKTQNPTVIQNPWKSLGKRAFSVPAADARTASLGSRPAGKTRIPGNPIQKRWKFLYSLQPRPARAPSELRPLRRDLGGNTVIRKAWKSLENQHFQLFATLGEAMKTLGESAFHTSSVPGPKKTNCQNLQCLWRQT